MEELPPSPSAEGPDGEGYLASLLGSLAGGGVGASLGIAAASTVHGDANAGLANLALIGAVLFLVSLGAALGAPLGCFAALRF